jgi:hypothetical protein
MSKSQNGGNKKYEKGKMTSQNATITTKDLMGSEGINLNLQAQKNDNKND